MPWKALVFSCTMCWTLLCTTELQDLLPDIINQLGPDSISSIRKLAESYQAPGTSAAGGVR